MMGTTLKEERHMATVAARTVAPSIAAGKYDRLFYSGIAIAMASTTIERPSESDQRMNSCRRSSVMWPVSVRIRTAASHSSRP